MLLAPGLIASRHHEIFRNLIQNAFQAVSLQEIRCLPKIDRIEIFHVIKTPYD